jgi:hypothetical protein
LAIPSPAVANLTGNVGRTLGENNFVQYAKMTAAATWNGFFPYQWWRPRTNDVCLDGYCAFDLNFTLNAVEQNYTQWSFWDNSPGGFTFIQFLSTPERLAGNLLRVFFDGGNVEEYDNILETGGQAAVTELVMARLREKFTDSDGPIPDPVDAFYRGEKNGYTYLSAGVPFTAAQQSAWAAEPLTGEKLCLVGESFNTLNSGWQEGAALSAQACMRGPVFNDVISAATADSWEMCINPTTEVVLDASTATDPCLLLENEYVIRDLAGLDYCGGPSVYNYPNSSFFNNPFGPFTTNSVNTRSVKTQSVYKKTDAVPNPKHSRYLVL